MIVKLQFCYEQDSYLAYIPDSISLNRILVGFYPWLDTKPEYVVIFESGNRGRTFNANSFIRYANEVLLKDSEEKAYIIPSRRKMKNWKGPILPF